MIKKAVLPKNYLFLKNRNFLEKFFSNFYSKPEVLKIKISSIKMSGNLKIFGEYKIKERNKIKKVFAIHRFLGTKIEEFEILKYLFNFKFREPKFLIPRSLFYFKKEKIIFYEALEGAPLSEIKGELLLKILKSKTKALSLALTQLQKTKPKAKIYDLEDDLRKFKVFENVLKKYFKKKVERDLIEELFSKLITKSRCYFENLKNFSFCHNDLTFGNLIYQKGKIGLIDFSESCFSDPLTDVGTFLAQLDYLLYLFPNKIKEIRKLRKEFKDSYLKLARKELKKEAGERIAVYRSWANLKNAIFVLGAEERFQNREACLWFLKLSQKILQEAPLSVFC